MPFRVFVRRALALELVAALSAVCQAFSGQSGVDFRVDVVGQQQPLRSAIQHEIYRIGAEALANAFSHSGAKRIHLEVEYGNSDLIVRVRDNGCSNPQRRARRALGTGRDA